MKSPRHRRNHLAMLTIAAELRAGGASWAKVGEKVKRSPETARRWPGLYPEEWDELYRDAERQVIATSFVQATLVLQNLLMSKDEKVRLAASKELRRTRERELEHEYKQAKTEAPPPGIVQFVTYIKGMTDDQFKGFLVQILAERASAAGVAGAGTTVASSPTQSG